MIAKPASIPSGVGWRSRIRPAVVHSVALSVSCLISYWLTTQLLVHFYSLSRADDLLGGMWAVIATVFVYRTSYRESISASLTRVASTLVSFALCLVYLLITSFHPWGLAVLIGIGTLALALIGRPEDIVTTGITTSVVMVVAALSPHDAWEQPILRLVDTGIGVGTGSAVSWAGLRISHFHRP